MGKTVEDIKRIEEKIARGEKLDISEMCEGFSIIDGKVTDSNIHDFDDPWDEEIDKLMDTGKTYLEAMEIYLLTSS